MTRVGITGHQDLADSVEWVRAKMSAVVATLPKPLVGYTSLAKGADQLFAEVLHEYGARLHVVIPLPDYERTLHGQYLRKYKELIALSRTEILNPQATDQDAFLAAGKRVADLVDVMIAVWNGLPAKGKGGTADIVHYCKKRSIPLVHINPISRTVVSDLVVAKVVQHNT